MDGVSPLWGMGLLEFQGSDDDTGLTRYWGQAAHHQRRRELDIHSDWVLYRQQNR